MVGAALGATDDKEVVAMLVKKIGFNLQQRVEMPECIKKSMELLFEFVAGVHIVHWIAKPPELILTGRLLLETPTGTYLLTNHRSSEFKFLTMRKWVCNQDFGGDGCDVHMPFYSNIVFERRG